MRSLYLFPALMVLGTIISASNPSNAAVDVGVSINLGAPPPPVAIAPPPLPVYVVPAPPQPAYVWTPGYWYWNGVGYFWVPGTWVAPPAVGLLWTPGYWGWNGAAYAWHAGYWGPHVGFYGGINYGGGYNGFGFVGGGWHGGVYAPNPAFINVSIVATGASFNGGAGGLTAHATAEEMAFEHEQHVEATHLQLEHINAAANNPQLAASFNHGKPPIAAVARANDFSHGVVAADRVGARNAAAEQHNIAIKNNPSAAHGALPRANATRANNAAGRVDATQSRTQEKLRAGNAPYEHGAQGVHEGGHEGNNGDESDRR